jgi:hypothetical protein
MIAIQSIWVGMTLSVAAMGFAAAGLLMPVTGAILQEIIDVLVILNALRALRGDGYETPPSTAGLAERYQGEHQRILPQVKRLRHLADIMDQLSPAEVRTQLTELYRFLKSEVVPHEESEEAALYPAVARLIGGEDPTAPMNRAHLEIGHMVSVLGRHLEELPPEGPDTDDLRDLRRILYGLDAVLRLHFAQEDEAYFALLEGKKIA